MFFQNDNWIWNPKSKNAPGCIRPHIVPTGLARHIDQSFWAAGHRGASNKVMQYTLRFADSQESVLSWLLLDLHPYVACALPHSLITRPV